MGVARIVGGRVGVGTSYLLHPRLPTRDVHVAPGARVEPGWESGAPLACPEKVVLSERGLEGWGNQFRIALTLTRGPTGRCLGQERGRGTGRARGKSSIINRQWRLQGQVPCFISYVLVITRQKFFRFFSGNVLHNSICKFSC